MDKRDIFVRVCEFAGVSAGIGCFMNSVTIRGSIVRAVNYHGTPYATRDNLARHFEYYSSHFQVLSEKEVFEFVAGRLAIRQVGLIISFDDGLRSNYTVAAKLLEEFQLSAFFFLPVVFIDLATASPERQKRFYLGERNGRVGASVDTEAYQPMSWDEVRDLLVRGHAVGSHSLTHISLGREVDRDVLRREIVESKRVLEERVNSKVASFCWPEGTLADYSRPAYELVRQHYQLGFTTFAGPLKPGGNPYAIHRSNVESSLSLTRVRAATNGMAELYFRGRRHRFEALVGETGMGQQRNERNPL